MKRHVNIPIFIPHLGCPNQCVFCNQRHISGVKAFDPNSVRKSIEDALLTIESDTEIEIAFFGGSFTGIDKDLMIDLLKIANQYIKQGRVSSIRCSTRPDYIDAEILDILSKYGVQTIELGLQSSDDAVLMATKRGHTFEDEQRACQMITDARFDLVGQMMIGLPGATPESEADTARFIASCGAVAARIYPTVVFRDTELCEMALGDEYVPLSLEEAIDRSVTAYEILLDSGLDVIRVGLCASENLVSHDIYFAGPNHPAIGELVMSRVFYRKFSRYLSHININNKVVTITVARGSLSRAIGQKKYNKIRLTNEFGLSDIVFREDNNLSGYEFKLEY